MAAPTLTHKTSDPQPTCRRPARHVPVRASKDPRPKMRSILRNGALQPQLTLGAPKDRFEQEADRIANAVLEMPAPESAAQGAPNPPTIRRMCAECEDDLQPSRIQRLCEECSHEIQRQTIEEEEEELMPKRRQGESPPLAADVAERIQRARSGGEPLSAASRSFFDPRFGRDFSDVRIHRDAEAGEIASSIGARAFALGKSIFFGRGEYQPATAAGSRLMAHELTHVAQQGFAPADTVRRNVAANSVCAANRDNAPADPIAELRRIDAVAQRMALSAAILLDFVSIDPTIFPSVVTAYRRYFGDPPAVTGGFRARFDGSVHTTREAALSEEMGDASNNFRRLATALGRDLRYRCTGRRRTHIENCTHQCGPDDLAAACAGSRMSSVAICPPFWDAEHTLDMRAAYLVHEAVHARLSTGGHPDPFRGRRGGPGCYENFVAEVNGLAATDDTCAAKF